MPGILLSKVELKEAINKMLLCIFEVVLERRNFPCLLLLFGGNCLRLSSESVDLLSLLVVVASVLICLEFSCNSQLSFLMKFLLDLVQLIPWEVGQLSLNGIEKSFSDQLVSDGGGLSL